MYIPNSIEDAMYKGNISSIWWYNLKTFSERKYMGDKFVAIILKLLRDISGEQRKILANLLIRIYSG